MKERPILMSGPMVRASLDDIKTQTRRIMKPQPDHVWGWGVSFSDPEHFTAHVRYPGQHPPDPWVRCPYGRPPYRGEPGDRLWVRETWTRLFFTPGDGWQTYYRADDNLDYVREAAAGLWRPSIHMPRWACRLLLEIVSIKVERLQDITEAGAIAEGAPVGWYERDTLDGAEIVPTDHRGGFRGLWNELNAKRGYTWERNPFVWVIEYKRIV